MRTPTPPWKPEREPIVWAGFWLLMCIITIAKCGHGIQTCSSVRDRRIEVINP